MFDAKNDDIDVVEFNNEMLVKSKDETNNHLWVERYTPKSYIDLLSDDVSDDDNIGYRIN